MDDPWALVKTLVDFSPAFFVAISADGKIIMMNKALLRALGYRADEVVGIDFLSTFVPEEDRQAVLARFERRRTLHQASVGQNYVIAKDGSRRLVEWHGHALFREDGEVHFYFSVGFDPTARSPTEEQLHEREQQYRAIFEATSDGLTIFDPETSAIVEANPAACRIYGYSAEELVGFDLKADMRPEQREMFDEYVRTVMSGGQFRLRDTDVRKDGSPIHVELLGTGFTYRGKPHILAVTRDITDQVESYSLLEQRVEERTRELKTLLDVSHNVASTLELDPLFGLILDQLKILVDYTGASILILEEDEMRIAAARGSLHGYEDTVGLRFPLSRGGMIWDLIRGQEPVLIDDVRGNSMLGRTYRRVVGDALKRPPFNKTRSWMGLPLALKDRLIGMIAASRTEPNFFTREHAALVMAIANQAAIAIENARLYQQAQTLAALEERQRLARDLHDSVSQALYGIALGARTARTLLDRDPSTAVEPLEYVLSLAEAGLAEMRALIFELRPESLEREGLVAALSKQVDSVRARHRIEVEATLGDEPEVSLQVKEAIYRIAQEALNNIVKHARATRIRLCLESTEQAIRLEVRDDGQGFDPHGSFPGHLGLRSMRERAAAIGGTVEVESAPGQGTLVRAEAPR
jgi:PAS domain S-box-containing protein